MVGCGREQIDTGYWVKVAQDHLQEIRQALKDDSCAIEAIRQTLSIQYTLDKESITLLEQRLNVQPA